MPDPYVRNPKPWGVAGRLLWPQLQDQKVGITQAAYSHGPSSDDPNSTLYWLNRGSLLAMTSKKRAPHSLSAGLHRMYRSLLEVLVQHLRQNACIFGLNSNRHTASADLTVGYFGFVQVAMTHNHIYNRVEVGRSWLAYSAYPHEVVV